MDTSEKFRIADADQIAWGYLVKGWTKGTIPRPASIDELRAQCRERGIAITLPDYVTGVTFVQNEKHELTIRLPPKDLHEAGERGITEGQAGYPLPSWYEQFFRSPARNPELSAQEKMDLHAARIGEYCVNQCG